MTIVHLNAARPSRSLIDAAIQTHGPARVLLAAAIALLRPKPRPPDLSHLPNHLRRDIGLLPIAYGPISSRYLN